MTNSQKLLLEQSKKRERINAILAKDEPTAEERAELATLTDRMQAIEVEYRAAVTVEAAELEQRQREAGNVPDAELRERIELRGRARLTEYLTCRAEGRLPSGAEKELAEAAGVRGIPIELWDVPGPEQRAGAEQRDITPAPGTVGVNLDPIRPAIFANSIAARLGIDMPRVVSGRTLSGRALVYGDVAPDFRERFVPGALGEVPATMPINLQHDAALVVVEAAALTDGPRALEVRAELPEGSAALRLVQRGALSGFSIEFHAKAERREAGVRVVERAELTGLALVDKGAYPASTAEVRAALDRRRRIWL